jgi:fatty-acyl-CoA synthase
LIAEHVAFLAVRHGGPSSTWTVACEDSGRADLGAMCALPSSVDRGKDAIAMHSTMMSFPLTLPPILERAGRQFKRTEIVSRLPDKSIHRYRYPDFYRRTRALGRALQQAGMRLGDRVATLMWNHGAHMEAYFGIPAAGGVVHTLNLRLHPDELAYIANHAGDRFLIVDDVLLPLLDKFKDKTRLEKIIVVQLTKNPLSPQLLGYEAFLESAKGELEYPSVSEEAPLGMCYTSGTTGKPKGVVYSHRAIVLHAFAASLTDTLALSERDTVLAVVPMFHANAWGIPHAATMIGAKQVLPGPHLDPESLLDLFEREEVTIGAGVPTIWLGILEELEKNPGRWKLQKGLRMVVGGAAAPESMIRAFDRHGLRVIHAWGMTEMTPLGTVSHVPRHLIGKSEDEQYRVRAMQGTPSPFVEIRAKNDDGEVPWDGKSPGELEVRGPWIAASYYNFEEARDRFTPDGWFKTGDVVTIDEDGRVKITDRSKDLIKSGGEWISSVDLENAIMGHPAVKEAAVIAVPHAKWSERPLAVVVFKDGKKASEQDLRDFLEPKFAKFWMPDAFVFTDAIPKTSAGKFKKSELRERYRSLPSG